MTHSYLPLKYHEPTLFLLALSLSSLFHNREERDKAKRNKVGLWYLRGGYESVIFVPPLQILFYNKGINPRLILKAYRLE